ncbi:hypothetical protein GCM10027610_071520 [Dactylosporangium cerinum]
MAAHPGDGLAVCVEHHDVPEDLDACACRMPIGAGCRRRGRVLGDVRASAAGLAAGFNGSCGAGSSVEDDAVDAEVPAAVQQCGDPGPWVFLGRLHDVGDGRRFSRSTVGSDVGGSDTATEVSDVSDVGDVVLEEDSGPVQGLGFQQPDCFTEGAGDRQTRPGRCTRRHHGKGVGGDDNRRTAAVVLQQRGKPCLRGGDTNVDPTRRRHRVHRDCRRFLFRGRSRRTRCDCTSRNIGPSNGGTESPVGAAVTGVGIRGGWPRCC